MAIRYIHFNSYNTTNLLNSKAQALVNTINCKGKMGRGIALQFKKRFPRIMADYEKYCAEGILKPGNLLRCRKYEQDLHKTIISFATKDDWKGPSKLEWIIAGLDKLVEMLPQWGITSIALPPLGCGNGKLDWDVVGPVIAITLGHLSEVDIEIYVGKYATEYYPVVENGYVVGTRKVELAPPMDDLVSDPIPEPRSDPRPTQDLSQYIPQIAEFVLP